MYKIMIHIETHTGDTWFYYQEDGKDYVANTLQEIKDTALTLIDVYGEDCIKIVKQETGDDMDGSVETFIYDSTDNYEELINRPSINGIEIVGELSLDALGIQPAGDYATREDLQNISLEDYATNERVDQVEAKVDAIDLEPYATMDYLDEVVAGIDFSASNENITGVKTFSVLPRSTVMPVTEDELTNKSYVDHEVLGCATEEYVDEAIANIQMPVFEVASLGAVQYDAYMTEEEGKRFLEYCNEHYNEFIQVYLYCPTLSLSGIYSGTPVANAWGNGLFKLYSNATGYKSGIIYDTHLYVDAKMTEDGRFDTTQSCRPYIHCGTMLNVSANYLSRTNTREYTPTTAYHPSTKKYVDDSVATLSNYVDEQLANLDVSGSDMPEHFYVLDLEEENIYLNNSINFNTDARKAKLLEFFNKIIKNEINRDNVIVILKNSSATNRHYICAPSHQSSFSTNKANGVTTFQTSYWGTYYDGRDLQYSNLYANITVNDTFTEVLKINSAGLNWSYVRLTDHAEKGEVLTKTNTTSFTPTGDYNPATKKYVDDSIAAIDIPTGSSNAIEQVTALPTASASNLGVVYQYVGNTNDTYTKGNYYVCVTNPRVSVYNDRITQYVWANASLSDLRKSIPLYTYMNSSNVYLTPGTHVIDSAPVKNQLSQIVKPYLNDYSPYIMLYCETSSSAGEYRKCLFTQNYKLDSSLYLEGDVTSISDPQKTAHVKMVFSGGSFDTYTYSGTITITVTERIQSGSEGGSSSRNLITIGLSTDTESTSYNSTTVPLDIELNKKGSKLSLDITNNAVKIGAGVSKILVSGTITQSATAVGLYGGNINKNGVSLSTAINVGFNYIPVTNVFFKTTLSPVLVDVVEGDLICLTTYAEKNDPLTIKAYDGRSTNLTVEVIE